MPRNLPSGLVLAVVASLLYVVPVVAQSSGGDGPPDPVAATDFETVQEQFDEIYDQANPQIDPADELLECLYSPTRLYADTTSLVAAESQTGSGFSLDDFGLSRATSTRIDPELIAQTGANLRMTELTLATPTSDDPADLATQLSSFDVFAAPDYQMFATPRMYFPGSFPLPRTPEAPLSYTTPDGEHNVYVLDTGIDMDQNYAVEDVLVGGHQDVDPAGASEDDPLVLSAPLDYVGGHGAFVAGVVAQQAPGVGIQVRAVSPPTTAPNFYESDFINAAARARAYHDSTNETEPMLTNISLGTSNCDTFGDLGPGEESLPVGTFRAVTEMLLKNPNDMIVAASGNSGGDEQITYPAALFNRPELAALELSLLEDIETRTIAEFSDQTLAVGASDHGRIAEYSTTGDWVDLYAEGCHVADYPNGSFVYPPSPVDSTTETRQFVTGAAEWCGSSFSTPLVAGMIADAWIGGASFAEAREGILARTTDVDGSLILGDLAFAPGINQVTDPSATDAIDTATDTCQLLFPAPDSARSVLLARDNIFADSLTGSPLASDDSCILFTPTETLDARTAAEIDRVLPDGGLIRILGGNAAVSDAIQAQLASRYTVERFGGVTRVQTAVAIANTVLAENPGQDEAMIAYANDFPDAVTGGAYGARTGTPVLLSDTGVLHPDTRAWLGANGISTGYLLGGTAVLGPEVEAQAGIAISNNDPVNGRVERVAGANRMGTAAAVATQLWGPLIGGSPENLIVLDLERPDAWNVALSAAPLAALCEAPQLGVRDAGTPPETVQYLVDEGYTTPTPTVLMMGPARDDGRIATAIGVP